MSIIHSENVLQLSIIQSLIMPKRKAWSVYEKLGVVDRVKKGETRTKICKELSLSESTMRGWLKDETKLRDFVDTVDEKEGLQ